MIKKIRILGIAPYKGLATLMKQCALQYPEIEFTAYAGSMEQGLALAKRYSEHYDVIISRANTAKMISQSVHIPVIDIGIGYYDVLRCIKMAQNTGTKFALLGFQSLTVIAKNLCDLLQIHVDIFSFSVDNWKGSGDLLDRMKEQGYKTVVCDMIPYDHAKMIGLTPILLTSSAESVKQAMENAIGTWQQYQKLCASAKIEFDGKVCNLSQLGPYQQSPDRAVRKAAAQAYGKFFDDHQQELDELFDKLVKNRTEQAHTLGLSNYVEMAYQQQTRYS